MKYVCEMCEKQVEVKEREQVLRIKGVIQSIGDSISYSHAIEPTPMPKFKVCISCATDILILAVHTTIDVLTYFAKQANSLSVLPSNKE